MTASHRISLDPFSRLLPLSWMKDPYEIMKTGDMVRVTEVDTARKHKDGPGTPTPKARPSAGRPDQSTTGRPGPHPPKALWGALLAAMKRK